MSPQQIGKGRRGETRMPHLDDMAQRAAVDLVRQQRQKCREAGLVEAQERGELPQDRAELVAQFEHAAGKKPLDRRARRSPNRGGG